MTLRSLTNLSFLPNSIVVRLDLNLPHLEGKILDPARLQAALPTLHHIKKTARRCVILAHWGRPEAFFQDTFSLKPFISLFQQYAPQLNVTFIGTPLGDLPSSFNQQSGFFLMENLRFYPGEESNSPLFVQDLRGLGQFFVNEAFSASHRSHASIVGLPQYLPSAAGFLFERELATIENFKTHPGSSMIILGGGKMEDKLSLANCFAQPASYVALGSAAAFNQPKDLRAHSNLTLETTLLMPKDGLDIEGNLRSLSSTSPPETLYDVGPLTLADFLEALDKVDRVLWNGPLGLCEHARFQQSTVALGKAIAARTRKGNLVSFVGGGETCAVLRSAGLLDDFSAFSYSGGALLSLLKKGFLPGIEALKNPSILHS